MVSARLISGREVFDSVSESDWNRLVQSGVSNTPFQKYGYQKAWWHHLGQGELLSVLVYENEREDLLIGLGCFNLVDGTLQFNASKEETDYLDIIADQSNFESVWDAIFSCLLTQSRFEWHTFDCWNLFSNSPSREILPRLAASRGFLFSEERAEVCPVIAFDGDFDSYLSGIDKKQRHEIKRKMRRAVGSNVEIEVIGPDSAISEEELSAALDDFLQLLELSTPEKAGWLAESPQRAALFRDVARSALADGSLLLMFTNVGGKRISALFNFVYAGRTWVYNSGIDISQYGNLSLGVVLTSHAIKYSVENGNQIFDFLRGNEVYKYRFGAKDTEIFRVKLVQEPVRT